MKFFISFKSPNLSLNAFEPTNLRQKIAVFVVDATFCDVTPSRPSRVTTSQTSSESIVDACDSQVASVLSANWLDVSTL